MAPARTACFWRDITKFEQHGQREHRLERGWYREDGLDTRMGEYRA